MHYELLITNDGSHSLFVPEIDECYHSTHGAIQESKHIFIEAGFKQCQKDTIKVLEVGFGTGLNAFLTMDVVLNSAKKVHYTGLELYPVAIEMAMQLNYPTMISPQNKLLFQQLHLAQWNKEVAIASSFWLTKMQLDFTQLSLAEKFDVIYFDAFSPEKQAEMWTEDAFKLLYNCCNVGGVLTTYCAKGHVRRAMQSAGFIVERLPGPPGKREILRCTKTE